MVHTEPSGPGTIPLVGDGQWVFNTWDLAPLGHYRTAREGIVTQDLQMGERAARAGAFGRTVIRTEGG